MELKFTAKIPRIAKYKTIKDKLLLCVSMMFYFPMWLWITLWTPILRNASFNYKFKWESISPMYGTRKSMKKNYLLFIWS